MRTKTMLTIGAAALALGAAVVWAFAPRPVEVELAKVVRAQFEATLDEDGKTRLAERYVVSAPLAGHLSRITLREGDSVAAGAVLAVLTPMMPAMLDERTQRELQARAESARDNIQRAEARIARARVAQTQARDEASRSEKLVQQGFIAPTKLNTDRLSVLATQRDLEAALAEQRIVEHELEQAYAAMGAARSAGKQTGTQRGFEVRAPTAGQVLRVLQASEVSVAMGAPLLELGDIARLEVVAELLTTDALALPPGGRVYIERWGGPQSLQGRIRNIEPAAFTKVSALGVEEQRVRVLIDLISPREQWAALGDGYRVTVRMVTMEATDAVQAPLSAVFPLPTDAESVNLPTGVDVGTAVRAAHAVFINDGGRAHRVPVLLGGRNTSAAWVRSGLSAGQSVVVYPPTTLTDGAAIRVRKQ
jgi:HlyD family secretion protein